VANLGLESEYIGHMRWAERQIWPDLPLGEAVLFKHDIDDLIAEESIDDPSQPF